MSIAMVLVGLQLSVFLCLYNEAVSLCERLVAFFFVCFLQHATIYCLLVTGTGSLSQLLSSTGIHTAEPS